jgi:hypothetical protein
VRKGRGGSGGEESAGARKQLTCTGTEGGEGGEG